MTHGLEHGSDYEIARRVIDSMATEYGQIVYADGQFWRYAETAWTSIETLNLQRRVLAHDGVKIDGTRIKMTASKLKSVLELMPVPVADPDFFVECAMGVNCQNGFIRFDIGDGSTEFIEHDPGHRSRHTISASWRDRVQRLPEDSLLASYLRGIFQDDPEATQKTKLLQEIAGAAIAGIATRIKQPKAHVLYGRKANNGKSTFLELVRSLLPETACSSIRAADFCEPRYLIRLAGMMFNGVDELSAAALQADVFKAVVTGQPCTAHDVYKPAELFRPQALQAFATNRLPSFLGGLDKGVSRRLLVLLFDRAIPEQLRRPDDRLLREMVPNLDQQIVEQEGDLLLAWAVEGASRLLRQGRYTEPQSSSEELLKWTRDTDPVRGWMSLRVLTGENPDVIETEGYTRPELYYHFTRWAEENGYRKDRLPGQPEFIDRLAEDFPSVRQRTRNSRRVRGITVLSYDKPDDSMTDANDLTISEIMSPEPPIVAPPPTFH